MNSKYNIGDTVKIIEDEIFDGALNYEAVDYDAIYVVTAIDDFHGVAHIKLENKATCKTVKYNINTFYAFIEAEITSYQDTELTNEKINDLEAKLENGETIEFNYNGLFYEIFESVSSEGYIVNVYSSAEKVDDEYLKENLVDGGLCSGIGKSHEI